MNAKEMEAAVRGLQEDLTATRSEFQAALASVRADLNGVGAVLNELRQTVASNGGAITAYITGMAELKALVVTTSDAHREDMLELLNKGLETVTSRVAETEAYLRDQVTPEITRLGAKVHATNKSAPIKRNMTDEDALAVLTGEFKDEGHKAAAERIGLTYAQVYSARGEFTFKHVHKQLRDSGWKNPWAK